MRFWKSPNAARLTTQDTAINPSTKDKKQPCDAGLYSIYNRNTDCPDAHSATGKMVFVDSVNGQLYIYKMDDDSDIKLYQNTKIPNTNKNPLYIISLLSFCHLRTFEFCCSLLLL